MPKSSWLNEKMIKNAHDMQKKQEKSNLKGQ